MAGRWWQRKGIALALGFLVTLPAVTTRLYAADEIEYYAYLRSLWFDRDLSFDNEYRHFYESGVTVDPLFAATFLELETATGRRLNFATIGAAVLWSPFYAVADVGVRAARLVGVDVEADGYSRPYIAAVTIGSAVYGALALMISAAVARRLTGRGGAAALAVLAGTPLVFYMYVAPGMAHACSAFVVAAFIWTWLRVRDVWSIRGVGALAALAAVMAMVREQDGFLVIVPAVDYAWHLVRANASWSDRLRQGSARLVAGGVVFAVFFLPQALSYLVVNGRLGPSPIVADKMYWTSPWLGGVLLSPAHGWLFWTPLVIASLAGLVWMAARLDEARPEVRRIGVLLLLAVVTEVYVTGSVASWTSAGAFGQRRFTGLTVCLVVGLAALLVRTKPLRFGRVVAALVAVAVWWNLALALQFGAGLMDRQRLELGRNAYTAFVEIPRRLPGLAYRYLFDRASFYRSAGD